MNNTLELLKDLVACLDSFVTEIIEDKGDALSAAYNLQDQLEGIKYDIYKQEVNNEKA